MAVSTITAYLHADSARVTSQTITMDVNYLKDSGNGGFAFLVVARSWAAYANSSSLYMVSGIQNGLYESCVQIMKETYGPTVALSNNQVKITFANTLGGHYALVPLYNVLS